MISKDQSIVTQVAAKIASELTNTTAIPDRSADAIQALYLSHFDFVRELLNDTHGFDGNVSVETQPVPQNVRPTIPVAQPQYDVADAFPNSDYESGGGIKVVNTQHGPLPAWLVSACQKAGVTQVWDNRDTANAENRRPLFKAADGPKKDGKALAFWAPKRG
jgi:hypothetical protein